MHDVNNDTTVTSYQIRCWGGLLIQNHVKVEKCEVILKPDTWLDLLVWFFLAAPRDQMSVKKQHCYFV